MACPDVERNPDRCGGNWVFKQTRIPVKDLFLHLSEGNNVEDFIESFPDISAQAVRSVLIHAASDLDKYARHPDSRPKPTHEETLTPR